jgi:Subtilase family
MAERNLPHILIQGRASAEAYRRPPRNISGKALPTPSDRAGHARGLRAQLEAADVAGKTRRGEQAIRVEGAIPGVYVTFESFPGVEIAFERLDPRRGKTHPELVAVREVVVDGAPIEQATVFIPEGKLGYFLRRIEQYLSTADQDKPRNRDLVDRIRSIGLASLEQLWTDPPVEFPSGDGVVWWEVWLRRRDGHEIDRVRAFAQQSGVEVARRTLAFPDRLVVLVRASGSQLAAALDVLDDLAELRRPREPAELIAMEPAAEQAEWVQELQARTAAAPDHSPAACIVDTGVHQPHPLISDSLQLTDCHACDPKWQVEDHDGHGTEMAGLALYGDLGEAVLSGNEIRLRHGLESVKFLPRSGANPPELYGAITATAASLVEIQAPKRRRVFSIATTARAEAGSGDQRGIIVGQPSSWSATVDALAAGLAVEVTDDGMVFLDEGEESARRLVLLSAGNVSVFDDDYLARSDIEPVEDPGQAWNAITVGAYTELTTLDSTEKDYDGWTPLAPHGELSPYSRTSVPFHRSWPIKPDVLLEGGNVARSPDGSQFDWPYSFQRLTTKAPLRDQRLFTVTRATSAATAQAAHLAASILAEYPNIWPETVRALIVHSAEWTPAMRAQFKGVQGRQPRVALQRRYGMGVPDLLRATCSAADALTLVAEDVIHPFDGEGRMREMHLHDLPWPGDILADLGGATVRLRVTLSYFIEPNPGRRGWTRRYRYPSHGLRFDVRRPTESNDDFRKRLNQLALAEEERRPTSRSDAPEWHFGPDQRVFGSLHTDVWEGTAAELAGRGAIAIYPVTGWWKERPDHDHSERGARYSLVVSIETPGQDVDIWTPVAQEVGIPIEIAT